MIDCHTHMPGGLGFLAATSFTARDQLAFMDRHGIDVSVVLTHTGLLFPSPAENDAMAGYVAADPARLIGFATVDPRRADAAEELERCVRERGLRGLKLHPWLQGFCVHDPFMDPVCEAAARLGVPILFHDGTPPYSLALQIAVLARRHPSVRMVLGHGGLHDAWREALVALETTPNLWTCLCGIPPYAAAHVICNGPLERIVVGTDAGLADAAGQPYAAARIAEWGRLDVTAGQREAILVDNPRRLLGLPRT
jgi:uncharacterized protein